MSNLLYNQLYFPTVLPKVSVPARVLIDNGEEYYYPDVSQYLNTLTLSELNQLEEIGFAREQAADYLLYWLEANGDPGAEEILTYCHNYNCGFEVEFDFAKSCLYLQRRK